MIWGKTRVKRAVHCPFGSDFGSNQKITVSIVALDMYDQYLSDCLKSLCSIMPGRKNRAKRAVRFFTTRLALVFIRGILVVFSLFESTPQIVGHLVYMLSCHLVTERFREKKLNFVYHFFWDTRYHTNYVVSIPPILDIIGTTFCKYKVHF